MVTLPRVLSPDDVAGMRRAGRVAATTLKRACEAVRPGVSTAELDALVVRDTAERGGRCAQHGYVAGGPPFPGHVCTSINEVICHGIPARDDVLEDGDLITIDVTTEVDGWHGDTARTVFVGAPSPRAAHLVQVTERAMNLAIEQVRPGVYLGEIGRVIQAFARENGCSVVRDFCGHGIGREMHQPPSVPHFAGLRGPRLFPGLCFTIEPMIALGSPRAVIDADGWTARTADGSLCAQFEHTVRVTEDGVEVLTRPA